MDMSAQIVGAREIGPNACQGRANETPRTYLAVGATKGTGGVFSQKSDTALRSTLSERRNLMIFPVPHKKSIQNMEALQLGKKESDAVTVETMKRYLWQHY